MVESVEPLSEETVLSFIIGFHRLHHGLGCMDNRIDGQGFQCVFVNWKRLLE